MKACNDEKFLRPIRNFLNSQPKGTIAYYKDIEGDFFLKMAF
jgi:hypothetical protein